MGNFDKIIVFGNPSKLYFHCWEGVLSDKIIYFDECYPIKNKFLLKRCKKVYDRYNPKGSSIKHRFIPLGCLWRHLFLKNLKLEKGERTLIIFYEWNRLSLDANFIKLLRARGGYVIYMISNPISSFSGPKTLNILNELSNRFDQVFTFDPEDASKYGFSYNPLIYEAPDPISTQKDQDIDLFYVGKAKDRLPLLIDIFEKATQSGLKCDFNIFGVSEAEQVYRDKINYNSYIPYSDVRERIKRSKILVDFPELGQNGLTIKICESIIFDKKTITSMESIRGYQFFEVGNIMLYSKDCDLSGFAKRDTIPYRKCDKDLFSVDSLLQRIKNKM